MSLLTPRKNQILTIVVRQYIKDAEPVGSKRIQDEYEVPISSATIRNEMVELEEMGMLVQPHISAGRIPTVEAYRYYINHVLHDVEPDALFFEPMMGEPVDDHGPHWIRKVARALSEEVGTGVFVASPATHLYYTGLGHLFNQPEFGSHEQVKSMGAVLDQLETTLEDLMQSLHGDVEILLGAENPLGVACSTVAVRVPERGGSDGVLGMMGPLRMDYDRALALLKGLQQLLTNEMNLK